ncbi:hypothetical protein BpOF4_01245 [Alkalihalophilus pseudofirmus OF4]|uniref:N-acetyltransferase domain-containing protein n=2 Tax=Alkalihalophilus pseudofirmus TaxID=79885 RepID=D3FUB5_ALKPO|nr:GNAT family N-acetyltransferase [Alkalihalophilus pseudofirmus]ADC48317.1 hypothetical protein BpOF4_01245 [Alkalihalophilus pseudofirmus OF4]MDV2885479.1 GNAT family N-acetyltransferase [Alkalihalophilus pseudofirmus]
MNISQEALHDFVWGLIACRYTYGTTVKEEENLIQVTYGYPVGDRRHELFITPFGLRKVFKKAPFSPHYLTLVTSRQEAPQLYSYYLSSSHYLMILEDIAALELSTSYKSADMKLSEITDYTKAQEVNTYFQLNAVNLEQIEQEGINQYVMYDHLTPVGFGRISSTRKSKRACLDNIYIDPDYRKQGLGSHLCEKIILYSAPHTTSWILASSQMGFSIYLKLGFRNTAFLFTYKKRSNSI